MMLAGFAPWRMIVVPRVLWGALATTCMLFAAASNAARIAPSLVGAWNGGFDLGRGPESVSLRIRDGGTGFLRPSVPWGDTLVVRVLNATEAGFRFVAGAGDTALEFDGHLNHGVLAGRMKRGRSRGPFELARTTAIPSSRLQGFIGDFDAGAGRTLVIGRSLGQLYSLEPDSGRQAPMFATSESTFVGGATIGTTYPMLWTYRFEHDSAGVATGVHWRRGKSAERFAPRVVHYDERDVAFASDTIRLVGAVLVPRTPGPHPGVVLVHGSNAQSRNGQESIYRFHADHLARRGIAVLIYDKRGIGGSGGDSNESGL